MIVTPGPASRNLGHKIANLMGIRYVEVESKFFPDEESYIRYTQDVAKEDVVIVQTTSSPTDTNLIQLLLMISTAKDLKAHSVTAIVPYLAYTRQDKRFRPGEAVSAKTIIKLIEKAGADRFITVNIHNADILKEFTIQAKNLSAIPLLAKHFVEHGLIGAFSLAPDEGAVETVREADNVLKGGYGWLEKERDRVTGEIVVEKRRFNVSKRDAVVFDDIISTGGTMATAVRILKDQGVRRVFAACVHPLLIGNAEERILKSGAEDIVGSDSVSSKVSKVSIAPIIVEVLKKGA